MFLPLIAALGCWCPNYAADVWIYAEGDEIVSLSQEWEDVPAGFLWEDTEVRWDYDGVLYDDALVDLSVGGESVPFDMPGGLEFYGTGVVGFGEAGFYVGLADDSDQSEIFVWDSSGWEQSQVAFDRPYMISRFEGEPLLWDFYSAEAGAGGPSDLLDLGTGESSQVTFSWDEPDDVNSIDSGRDGTLYAMSSWEVATETCTSGVLPVDYICDVVPHEDGVLIWQIHQDEVILQTMDSDCNMGAAEVQATMDGPVYGWACDNVFGGANLGMATFMNANIELKRRGRYKETTCAN